jgi:hypothetical protein
VDREGGFESSVGRNGHGLAFYLRHGSSTLMVRSSTVRIVLVAVDGTRKGKSGDTEGKSLVTRLRQKLGTYYFSTMVATTASATGGRERTLLMSARVSAVINWRAGTNNVG